MKNFIRQIFNPATKARALVLMYHRIGEATSDVWDITVSPQNFEAQLKILQKKGTVISLPELVAGLHKKNIPTNSIALSFDDGYADNFITAKPLLEAYQIPATFFISSHNLGQHREFWWDELEHLFLFAEQLPAHFSLTIRSTLIQQDLSKETALSEALQTQHHNWKAFVQEPPTARTQLFLEVWTNLRPLPFPEQQEYLQKIRDWAGTLHAVRENYTSMSVKQLREMAASHYCSIGVHTVHHAALAAHTKAYQTKELKDNKQFLEEVTSISINLLAYPYGNYNEDTFYAAADLHFHAGFTTLAKPIWVQDHPYGLGRFQVKDLTGPQFADQLTNWEKSLDIAK